MNANTDSTQLIATFELQKGAIEYLSESQFGVDLVEAKAIAKKVQDPFGRLVVEFADRPRLVFADDLLPMASNLGVALKSLKRDKSAYFVAFSQPFRWQMSMEGEQVVVVKDNDPPQTYPAQAFQESLARCHARLVTALTAFQPQNPYWESDVAQLKAVEV